MRPEQFLADLTGRLLTYFGTVAVPRHHLFTLSELNLQVMLNSYAANERDILAVALAGLVDGGDLHAMSPTSYTLTDQGMRRVQGLLSLRTTPRGRGPTRAFRLVVRAASEKANAGA